MKCRDCGFYYPGLQRERCAVCRDTHSLRLIALALVIASIAFAVWVVRS